MATINTVIRVFCIELGLKEVFCAAAEREHRYIVKYDGGIDPGLLCRSERQLMDKMRLTTTIGSNKCTIQDEARKTPSNMDKIASAKTISASNTLLPPCTRPGGTKMLRFAGKCISPRGASSYGVNWLAGARLKRPISYSITNTAGLMR